MTAGKPDPPHRLSVTGCTKDTVGLKWEPPDLDGGSPVTGYVVEMRPTNKKAWTKVDDTQSLKLTAHMLSEGVEYVFRVAAQNAVGVGEFAELQKPIVPKSEFGKQRFLVCRLYLSNFLYLYFVSVNNFVFSCGCAPKGHFCEIRQSS